ncbi:MAG: cation:proton antiporter, partial [Muribaculaceae bacterium]|nr:cation:proton antiporter [Muribaculaceae bacterium]
GVGYMLHLNTINCIFLGGMISMSSTTIILKAFTDLGLKQQKFASMVLAVLIIEDLFAVLMLVLLSSFAMGDVQGSELVFSIAKLCFFLIIWFVVGVYVLPSFLEKFSSFLNSETLLVVSMGLCFSMAAFSVMCGFSLELGAFVMGSILAGTIFAERMEHVIAPVKDLFGAVFFISVGMMVQPSVIATYYPQILLLAAVVIVGMIIFGTIGMLVTGQTLQVAIKSGFSLTQIGEFSFIIASLGMGLGVLDASLYPIIVAVSVITIFTTPYFIKLSSPAYNFVEKHLPENLKFLITRYSSQVVDTNETKRLWREILGRYIWRIVLYSVILIAIIIACRQLLFPLMENLIPKWGHLVATVISLVIMSPFLTALSFTTIKSDHKMKLHQTASFYEVPLIAMSIIRYILALLFVVYFLTVCYSSWVGWIGGTIGFVLMVAFASSKLMRSFKKMEKKFMNNLNNRENARSGANNNLVSDLHQAYLDIKPQCRFAGDKLKDSGLRSEFGVSVSSIRRGDEFIPLPTGDTRIFPGDTLGVIGTDSQIKRLNDAIDKVSQKKDSLRHTDIELKSILLTQDSPIIDRPLFETDLRNDYFCMVISVQRGDSEFINPNPNTVLKAGDLLWIVGDPAQFDKMK